MITGDRMIRAATALVVVGIGGVAAYVSYRHAYDVATTHGEVGAPARLLPLTIDGLVFVASMVLLDSARRGLGAPALAGWALALGIAATLAANVAHGAAHGWIGGAVSAWPAVCLVVVVELLMGMIRTGRVAEQPAAVPVAQVRQVRAPQPVPEPDPQHIAAAEVFADDITAGRVPGIRAIKQQLRIGQPKASEVRTYLAALAAEEGGLDPV